jgi:hypothetical protein
LVKAFTKISVERQESAKAYDELQAPSEDYKKKLTSKRSEFFI